MGAATEKPRRLRLDELLEGLRSRTPAPPAFAQGSTAAPGGSTEPPRRAGTEPGEARLPEKLACAAGDPAVPTSDLGGAAHALTVGELVDQAAEGGFGFLIGILALIAIPFFGLSTPFGLAIALIGAQLMLGREHPWLPQRARRRPLSMAMLDRVAAMMARRTSWLAQSTCRRHEYLIQPRLIGLGIVILALGLALPLPIPGSNLVFLIPLFIYAIGLLERDGVWIAIGHAWLVTDVVLLAVFGNLVWLAVLQL